MWLIVPFLLLRCLATPARAQQITDLSESSWTLQSQNGSISVPGSVPSLQYVDLLNAGVIEDPLYGMNNEAELWVSLQNWTYTTDIPQDLLSTKNQSNSSTILVFQGLDTYTHISLCGRGVADTDNQFRQWIVDVTDSLAACTGSPQLQLNFGSAINISNAVSVGVDADGTVNYASGCVGDLDLGCKPYARKEQSDFGWDWAPALAPAGPWKPIYAVQLGPAEIYVNNAAFDVYRKGQQNNLPPDQSQPWIFNASIDFVGTLPSGASLSLTLTDDSGTSVLETSLSSVYSSAHTITGSTTIDSDAVQLWWPNGMGAQPLYNATVKVVATNTTGKSGSSIATVNRRVGFRTVVLNLQPITDKQLSQGVAPGSNWHFEVNGNEFYAKGSNLVPPDVFWPRVNETKVSRLFSLAKNANMNLLRVWSSGVYLDDWIYDIADEMGLFLWSEFEFTDAEYPNATSFLENYEAEAYYNIRRVNHHPSLALWAGGNELEAIQLAYFFNPDDPSDATLQYEQVFEELLIKCVYANSKSISYIPSSTYNGYLSLDFDSVRPQTPRYKNTSGPEYLYSDTDSYNDDYTTIFDLNSYPVGRFADEFGFISFSSLQSLAQEIPEDQLYTSSPDIVDHNRHVPFGTPGTQLQGQQAGINEMLNAVVTYLPTPQATDPIANFSAWTWSTQVIQAENYVQEIAFYRRGSGKPERQLGCLYWMLNDLWDGSTWASIEYNNRQKVLYYAVRDIYQPVIVASYYNTSTTDLQIWVTSDLHDSVSGVLTYKWIDWTGKPLSSSNSTNATSSPTTSTFTIGPLNSTQVLHYTNLTIALPPNTDPNSALLVLTIKPSSSSSFSTHRTIFHPPRSPALISLPNPNLTLTKLSSSSSSVTFTASASSAVAAYVWVDYTSPAVTGYWSDNGFWLLPGELREVTFHVWQDWSDGAWVETVSVRSLWNNTLT